MFQGTQAALHETYLLSFAEAVRAGTGSIMCSYNRINGSYGCESSQTLNRILKGELNYQGYVVSDWFAQWTNESAPLGGLDMTMPGTGFWGSKLVELVENGDVPMARLDDMAHRILTPYYALGQDIDFPPLSFNTGGIHNKGYVSTIRGNKNVNVQRDHYKLIRKIGEESITLLKNERSEGGGLPLKQPQFLALFGQDAGPNPAGLLVCGPTNLCPGDSTNNVSQVLGLFAVDGCMYAGNQLRRRRFGGNFSSIYRHASRSYSSPRKERQHPGQLVARRPRP
jgi:beta-glucosidase